MNDLSTIVADVPGPYRVAFSTRTGGASEDAYASLNLGLRTDDRPEAVFENRRRLFRGLGVDPSRASMRRQVHGNVVARAHAAGVEAARDHPEGDGVWTDRPMEPVLVLSADCVPIALCRQGSSPAVAAVHAGWRGLIGGVLDSAIASLGTAALHASIGPSIGPCCYEVGSEVAEPFRARFGHGVTSGRQLDLRAAARRALEALGVRQITTIDECTACEEDRFFSHRRDQGQTGRQGLVAFIENRGP